jgi:hypothetical protein
MPVLINCTLCEPPSEVVCFRDVTLYANVLLGRSVLLECDPSLQDIYWTWLKQRHAWDFIKDIVPPKTIEGVSIREDKGNITVPRISYGNLDFVIGRLSILARH